jgi:hypothetical protein
MQIHHVMGNELVRGSDGKWQLGSAKAVWKLKLRDDKYEDERGRDIYWKLIRASIYYAYLWPLYVRRSRHFSSSTVQHHVTGASQWVLRFSYHW